MGNQQSHDQQHNLHQSHRLINSGAQTISSPTTHSVVSPGVNVVIQKDNSSRTDRTNSLQEVGVVKPHPPHTAVCNGALVVGKSIKTKTSTQEETKLDMGRKPKREKVQKFLPEALTEANGVERQRSTDSFTLSSSPSEGEAPTSSEGASQNEDQRAGGGKGSKIHLTSSSSSKNKKSSKKQSKKAKKSQKRDKNQGGQSSSMDQKARSKKISKRREYVLERIRSDSLTSSDEEHCLVSSEMNSSVDSGTSSLLQHQDSILEDGESAVVDVEKLKLHLQRRIMAKKPPAQFETPSTQPVFHEVHVHVKRVYNVCSSH